MDHLVEVSTDVLAFLYRENNIQDEVVLDQLENIDDDLFEIGIQFVKCSDKGVERHFGLGTMPAVVHFRHGNFKLIFYGFVHILKVFKYLI